MATTTAMDRVYGMCAWMTSITGTLAILATMALWAFPGLQVEPQVPAKTAAAAMAGWIPAAIMAGISTTPTAAVQPAALGSAMLMNQVTSMAPGMRSGRTLTSGSVSILTRWALQPVSSMTAAKPMTGGMAWSSPATTMFRAKASDQACGFRR